MVIEPSKRRETIDLENSEPIVMADGQTWWLPKPLLILTPVFENGKPVNHWNCFRYGTELDQVLEMIPAAQDNAQAVVITIGLAAKLLLHNYDLTDEELSQVLFYRIGDPDSDRILRDVIDVATGGLFKHGGRGVLDDPKPPSAGSDAA